MSCAEGMVMIDRQECKSSISMKLRREIKGVVRESRWLRMFVVWNRVLAPPSSFEPCNHNELSCRGKIMMEEHSLGGEENTVT